VYADIVRQQWLPGRKSLCQPSYCSSHQSHNWAAMRILTKRMRTCYRTGPPQSHRKFVRIHTATALWQSWKSTPAFLSNENMLPFYKTKKTGQPLTTRKHPTRIIMHPSLEMKDLDSTWGNDPKNQWVYLLPCTLVLLGNKLIMICWK
jgi:hypothetical protein